MSATFAAFGCHRKTHTQPVIHAFLGDVDSGAQDKNSWTVKSERINNNKILKIIMKITLKKSQPKNNAIKIGPLHFQNTGKQTGMDIIIMSNVIISTARVVIVMFNT